MGACRKSMAHQFILKRQEGLDYIVGTRGSKLSGGEKQRIAIARAILSNPKILILDETTSALDNKNEKEVQLSLNRVSQGITIIVIAHRLSTIINLDKIVVLQKGKIVEEGTHKFLLDKNGPYTRLVKSQIGITELENETQQTINSKNTNNNDFITITQPDILTTERKDTYGDEHVSTSLRRRNSIEELEEQVNIVKRKKVEFEKIA